LGAGSEAPPGAQSQGGHPEGTALPGGPGGLHGGPGGTGGGPGGTGGRSRGRSDLAARRLAEVVPAPTRSLFQALAATAGLHESWEPPELAPSPWCERLAGALASARRSDDAASSHAERLLDALERAAGYLVDAAGGEPVTVERAAPQTPHSFGRDVGADPEGYREWFRERYLDYHPRRLPVPEGPTFSVVVPVYRPQRWMLERCVASVLAQSFPHLQLCLSLDGPQDAAVEAYASSLEANEAVEVVRHPVNQGISGATNLAIAIATGQLVAVLDQDDEVTEEALEQIAVAALACPDADVIYSDEDKLDPAGRLCEPFFKPDWSPEYLDSLPYLGHLLVVRRRLLYDIGGLRSALDGAQDYDLMLRATERARRVVHVPEVLYHWRKAAGSAAADANAKPWAHRASRRALQGAVRRRGEDAEVARGPIEGWYYVRRDIPDPAPVSIVIPFRDQPRLLRRCVDTLAGLSGYPLVELVLVDNDSEEPETLALMDRLAEQDSVRLVNHPGAFNWSAVNNHGVAEAAGHYLLFANNDLEARSPGWLRAMVEQAQRPAVGAVGARLLYPDGAIQHAGVVLGMGGTAGHVYVGLPPGEPGYMAMARVIRDVSAVTGACLLTRREVFEAVGGFDESYAVAFNDIDFCLRVGEAGYRIVYTPLAELVHHESRSRGYVDDTVETGLLVTRWHSEVSSPDPFYSPNLTRLRPDCSLPLPDEPVVLEALSHAHRAKAMT
ncbi:MAG: glycosyltransferase family 2 protein, partial [Acidimicrobiales bacterium]